MNTKTALLGIFLTVANISIQADLGLTESEMVAETEQPGQQAQNDSATEESTSSTNDSTVPDSKYVSEPNTTNAPKKDNSRLYNFLLALAAVAIATAAIIIVSNNKGKKSHRN